MELAGPGPAHAPCGARVTRAGAASSCGLPVVNTDWRRRAQRHNRYPAQTAITRGCDLSPGDLACMLDTCDPRTVSSEGVTCPPHVSRVPRQPVSVSTRDGKQCLISGPRTPILKTVRIDPCQKSTTARCSQPESPPACGSKSPSDA